MTLEKLNRVYIRLSMVAKVVIIQAYLHNMRALGGAWVMWAVCVAAASAQLKKQRAIPHLAGTRSQNSASPLKENYLNCGVWLSVCAHA
jgi:hypothetical protein